MAAEPDPLDADALASVGIDLDTVRRATDATSGRAPLTGPGPAGPAGPGRMRLTADAKKALELALRTAARLRQREITAGTC